MKQSTSLWFICFGFTTLLGGCAEWPRSANLPADEALVPGSTDLGDLFEIEWTAASETIDEQGSDGNNAPTAARANYGAAEMGFGKGVLVTGGLTATGWNATVPVPALEIEECGPQDIFGDSLDTGFYIGDLDFYMLEIPDLEGAAAELCGIVEAGDALLGWDLLLVNLKTCEEPSTLVTTNDGENILGYGMGGANGAWSTPVETGDVYAVMLSGYTDNSDDEETVRYRLGAALIHAGSGDAPSLCPTLPASDDSGEEE